MAEAADAHDADMLRRGDVIQNQSGRAPPAAAIPTPTGLGCGRQSRLCARLLSERPLGRGDDFRKGIAGSACRSLSSSRLRPALRSQNPSQPLLEPLSFPLLRGLEPGDIDGGYIRVAEAVVLDRNLDLIRL
jgi:hypothetical protein